MAPRGMKVNGVRIARARLRMPGSPNQAEFAKSLGIHWVTQSNIENGKAKVSLELLERIAAATGTSREYLIGSDEDDAEAAPMAPLAAEKFFNTEALDAFLLERAQKALSRASHPQGERATESQPA